MPDVQGLWATVEREGAWGPVTSSIDWCEPNYTVSLFIAEWWNTMSNIGLVLLPLISIIYIRKYRLPSRFVYVALSYSVVGLGSALFHATLLFYMQLADELPMLWSGLLTLHVLLQDEECAKKSQRWFGVAFFLFGIAWSAGAPWTHKLWPIAFEAIFLMIELISFYLAARKVVKSKYTVLHITFAAQCLFACVAFTLWNIDNIYCTQIRESAIGKSALFPYFGSLHGYWHLLMAWHVLCGLAVALYLHTQTVNMEAQLRWDVGLPQVIPRVKKL